MDVEADSGTKRRRKWWLLILLPGVFFSCCFPWHMLFWSASPIELPDGSGGVIFEQKGAHPFLAEYYYRVRIETDKQHGVTLSLPANSGGRTDIDVWWCRGSSETGPFMRFKSTEDEALVDLAAAKSYAVFWFAGVPYGGDLAESPYGVCLSWMVPGDTKVYAPDGTLQEVIPGGEVLFEGHPAVNLSGLVEFDGGLYLGHIGGDGRFSKAED